LRPQQLAGCLRALSRLRYPRDRVEVIVVDDGRLTPPGAVVES
jgi:cellulose synthase/poly-beta-1,6-N-acetylglucosamine synthase-like glycosyltransferase